MIETVGLAVTAFFCALVGYGCGYMVGSSGEKER